MLGIARTDSRTEKINRKTNQRVSGGHLHSGCLQFDLSLTFSSKLDIFSVRRHLRCLLLLLPIQQSFPWKLLGPFRNKRIQINPQFLLLLKLESMWSDSWRVERNFGRAWRVIWHLALSNKHSSWLASLTISFNIFFFGNSLRISMKTSNHTWSRESKNELSDRMHFQTHKKLL